MKPRSVRDRYRICGLHVASTIRLPELGRAIDPENGRPADVVFEMKKALQPVIAGLPVMSRTLPDGSSWLTCFATAEGYWLHFPGFADFSIARSGRAVRCTAQPGTPLRTIRHLFLDQVVPLLLNLTGREALHASAVCLPQGVCAFVGESGSGKSTLAGAYHRAGYPVITDDCLPVRNDSGKVLVESAYPGLRLWEDSRGALFGDSARSTPVSHYSTKVRIPTPEAEDAESSMLQLRAVYALRRDNEGGKLNLPVIEPLSMRDGLMALIEYAFRLDLSDRGMILRQIDVFELVARAVPVRRLHLPNDLSVLPAARDLVLRDLANG